MAAELRRWNLLIQVGHWTTVTLLVPAFATGFWGTLTLGGFWHASLGVAVLTLFLVRLLVRAVSGTVRMRMRRWSLLYAGLYMIAIALALSGLTAIQRSPFTPPLGAFGLQLPSIPFIPSMLGAQAHTFLAYLLLSLIAVHLLGLLARRLNGERGVLARMLPSAKAKNTSTLLTLPLWNGAPSLVFNAETFQMLNFQVNDMTCSHCVGTVEKAVKNADPAAKVSIDLATKAVRIDSAQPATTFARALEDAGYTGTLQS